MEGWIIWIIIIVGFAIFRGISEKNQEETIKEVFDENKLSLKIKEEIPPKDVGIKVKCFSIKMKGWIGNPTEDKTKMILTIHDNTDTADDEFGFPV